LTIAVLISKICNKRGLILRRNWTGFEVFGNQTPIVLSELAKRHNLLVLCH